MSVLTRGAITGITGTIGTSSALILAANVVNNFLQVHNPAASGGNSLAFTLDGTNPVVNGNGITLYPGGTATYSVFSPSSALKLIASGSSSAYTVYYN